DVDCRYRWFGAPGVDARTAKRVWHPRDQDISGFEKRAAEFPRLLPGEKASGSIQEPALSDISELGQPYFALRILIFRLNPVTIGEEPPGANQVANPRFRPAGGQGSSRVTPHAANTSV